MNDSTMVTQADFPRDEELDALESHVRSALERAVKGGASEAEVSAHSSQGLSATVRMGDVETLEHTRDRGLSITVFQGKSKGNASSGDLSNASIENCVDRAIDIARFTEQDSCNGLAPEDCLATQPLELDLWHPVDMDAGQAIERALACEAAGREDVRITNSEGATFNAASGLAVYGNSLGFVGRSSGTRYDQSCVLIAGSGSDMQRDYEYDTQRNFADLQPVEITGQEAARKTVRRLNSRRLKTAEMPVLLAPQVAKGFIGHLLGAISGTALYRNASFLKDSAGEQLFPDWFTATERPHLRRGAASAWFDNDGVATRQWNIVDAGILTGYVLSVYSSRRLGLETTGNAGGVRNLLVTPGGEGHQDPLQSMRDGLYVTEVMGQGVNLLTGDYSRGAAGFLVENGELQYPVEEITIAGNLRDMFATVAAAGDQVDTRGSIHTGPLLLANMTVAGE
jgi:PmbA protein